MEFYPIIFSINFYFTFFKYFLFQLLQMRTIILFKYNKFIHKNFIYLIYYNHFLKLNIFIGTFQSYL
jgi:hypothetical protein